MVGCEYSFPVGAEKVPVGRQRRVNTEDAEEEHRVHRERSRQEGGAI
jgi:hypothetical protein